MNNYIVIICIGIGGAVVLITIIIAMFYRKKTEHAMDTILNKLDEALSGNMVETKYDESMESAISERLNRVLQIAGIQKIQAQEERDSVKALVSDISHQVRTPLSNIMLYSGLLREQGLHDSATKLADKIQSQSEKLDFFMKELIKSSRTEQKMVQVTPELTVLSKLVDQACQLVEVDALRKRITIQYQEENGECYADKTWTVEVIGNVLDNAIKYSPEGSIIQIWETVYDSFIGLTIKDNGMGIEEKEQGFIFQRFYRSAKAAGIPGFGIGLYLVREVLLKQGGYVKVNSKAGEGAAFQLFFTKNHS